MLPEQISHHRPPGAKRVVRIGIAWSFLTATLAKVTFHLIKAAVGSRLLEDSGKQLVRLIQFSRVREIIATEQLLVQVHDDSPDFGLGLTVLTGW